MPHTPGPAHSEQVYRAESHGPSVDVFSFALLLLELLTGVGVEARFEQQGISPRNAVNFHNAGKRLEIENLGLDAREAARTVALIEDCWIEDKEMRPTFEEILKALESDEDNEDNVEVMSLPSPSRFQSGPGGNSRAQKRLRMSLARHADEASRHEEEARRLKKMLALKRTRNRIMSAVI